MKNFLMLALGGATLALSACNSQSETPTPMASDTLGTDGMGMSGAGASNGAMGMDSGMGVDSGMGMDSGMAPDGAMSASPMATSSSTPPG